MQSNQSDQVAEFCQSVFKVRYKLRRMFQLKIKEAGIMVSYEILEILKVLSMHNQLNQQELADLLFKDKSSMTYLINNMVKAELVTRQEDMQDRRNKHLILSDKATELIEQLNPIAAYCYAALAKDISGHDIEVGLQTLFKMNSSLTGLMSQTDQK
jgi:DNA-binding MarR family transcriptional regulator